MSRTARIVASGVRALARTPLRTVLMMLGTFAGVTALTVILAIGRGTQQDVMDRVQQMLGGSSVLLHAGGNRIVGRPHGAGPTTTLSIADLEVIRSAIPAVRFTDPMLMSSREVSHAGRTTETQVLGHSDAAEIVWSRGVTSGTFISAADVASTARVALIGATLARELFDRRDPVGEQVRIAGIPFRVIGILETVGADPHGIDKDRDVIIPVSTMMRRVLNIDYIMGAKILFADGTDLEEAVLAIGDVLRDQHALGPDEPDDFAMFTPVQVQQVVHSTNRVFTVFLPMAAALSLAIGGLIVANLMLMAVSQRSAEIGLRKAVGARSRDIRIQFLTEAAAVTTLAGLLGLAASVGILWIIASHGGPTAAGMPWSIAGIGLGAAIAVGIVSGVAPAHRAAALDPIHTLR
ncbi:MAG: ABC transporter permease [Longimicrobiales bacterium]